MSDSQTIEVIELSGLLERVKAMKFDRYRLVQICASLLPEGYEILYSFDHSCGLVSLRLKLPADAATLPSISGIYGAAILYENEIHDLFGLKIENLIVDFHGHFFETAVKYPMSTKMTPVKAPAKAGGI
jgi:ech hydrogenase subunit D